MCHFADGDEIVRSEQRNAIRKRKPFTGLDFVPDREEQRISEI
jgi:hypothetical protein